MALILAVASGCSQKQEQSESPPQPVSTNGIFSVQRNRHSESKPFSEAKPNTSRPASSFDFATMKTKAEAGDAAAQAALANYYATGQGSRIDLTNALK